MVRVEVNAANPDTAWRVRDALASHPLLGGATAQITVVASRHCVMLEGWTVDEQVKQLAMRLARRAAGRCAIQLRLQSHQHQQTEQEESGRNGYNPQALTER